MENIDAGVEKISVYRPEHKADLKTVEEAFNTDLAMYDFDSLRIAADQEYMDLAAEAVKGLLEDDQSYENDFFGIFVSSDQRMGAEASKISGILQEDYDISFSTDGTYLSDSRMLQSASSEHSERARPGEYSIAVSSSTGNPSNGEGSAAVAYLIGDNPFLELSRRGGLNGIHDGGNSFEENLESVKYALDGFIEEATKFPIEGTSVTCNNSDLVKPDNVDYALFNIAELEKRKIAAARGFGRVSRQAKTFELDFQTDPDKRDSEEYMDNLLRSEDFRRFYERAVEPALKLENNTGIVNPGSIGLQRASMLSDPGSGIVMVGSLGMGGRNAEVHAEEVVGEPKVIDNSVEARDLTVQELLELTG